MEPCGSGVGNSPENDGGPLRSLGRNDLVRLFLAAERRVDWSEANSQYILNTMYLPFYYINSFNAYKNIVK